MGGARSGGAAVGVPGARRLLLILLLTTAAWVVVAVGSAHHAEAVPAAEIVSTLEQPDGTAFAARAYGDEHAHGVETADGYTVLRNSRTHVWHYAERAAGGRLRASTLIPGRDAPHGLPRHLRDRSVERLAAERADAAVLPEPVDAVVAGSDSAPSLFAAPTTTHSSLVILAKFDDQAASTTPAVWQDRFFGASGSLKDYYEEVSYGDFAVAPAAEASGASDGIVGWVHLNQSHPYPENLSDLGEDTLAVAAAIEASAPYVNYATYDTDSNGHVTPDELHVTVIFAGEEQSYGADDGANSVWGHWYVLYDFANQVPLVEINGVSVGGWGYTAFGEMHNVASQPHRNHPATLGVVAHEFGHDLGWPDLYDTDAENTTSNGVGKWSVMSGGAWLSAGTYSGETPAHPDAWSKWYQGWITPTAVTNVSKDQPVAAAASAASTNVAIQLRSNPFGPTDWVRDIKVGSGEYFLVENRQRLDGSFDEALPGDGLLVWHIDETRWDNSTDARRLVDLEEADGLNELDTYSTEAGDNGDPFPGSTSARVFSATSAPNSLLNATARRSGVTIKNISNSATTMSADFYLTSNDAFSQAQTLSGESGVVSGNNVDGSKETGEPNHATGSGGSGGASVWFNWTAPTTGTYAFETRADAATLSPLLGVYTGTTVNGLTTVAQGASGSALYTHDRRATIDAVAGQTYRVAVDGNSTAGQPSRGTFDLQWAPVTQPVAPSADLSLSQSGQQLLDGSVQYQMTVYNNGPDAADNVSVVAALPASLTDAVVSSTTGTCVAATLTCTWTALANDATATMTVTAQPTSNGQAVGTSSVTSNTADPNVVNNSAESTVNVTSVVVPAPDLSVELSATNTTRDANYTYTVAVANDGDVAADAVTAGIVLPAAVALVPSASTSACDITKSLDGTQTEVYCLLGDVDAAATKSFTVRVTPGTSAALTAIAGVIGEWSATPTDTYTVEAPFICDRDGTAGSDVIEGTKYSEVLCGLAGNDVLRGAGGNDVLLGGTGIDKADYATSPAAVLVDLAQQGFGTIGAKSRKAGVTAQGNDRFHSIERAQGSAYGDELRGRNTAADALYGLGGADLLTGLGWNDLLVGGDQGDTLYGGTGYDDLRGGRGTDYCRNLTDKLTSCEK